VDDAPDLAGKYDGEFNSQGSDEQASEGCSQASVGPSASQEGDEQENMQASTAEVQGGDTDMEEAAADDSQATEDAVDKENSLGTAMDSMKALALGKGKGKERNEERNLLGSVTSKFVPDRLRQQQKPAGMGGGGGNGRSARHDGSGAGSSTGHQQEDSDCDDETMREESEQPSHGSDVGGEDAKLDGDEEDEDDLTQKSTVESYDDECYTRMLERVQDTQLPRKGQLKTHFRDMSDEVIDKALLRLLTEGVILRDGKHLHRYVMAPTEEEEEEDEEEAEDVMERAIMFVFDPASTATHLTKERLSKHLGEDADSEITGIVLNWMTRSGFLGPALAGKGRRIDRNAKSTERYDELVAKHAAAKASDARSYGLESGGISQSSLGQQNYSQQSTMAEPSQSQNRAEEDGPTRDQGRGQRSQKPSRNDSQRNGFGGSSAGGSRVYGRHSTPSNPEPAHTESPPLPVSPQQQPRQQQLPPLPPSQLLTQLPSQAYGKSRHDQQRGRQQHQHDFPKRDRPPSDDEAENTNAFNNATPLSQLSQSSDFGSAKCSEVALPIKQTHRREKKRRRVPAHQTGATARRSGLRI
jgi:hypothetical protein